MQITVRDPGSALTHFIAMMMAILASVPLLLKAGLSSGPLCFTAMAVFMCSMVLLYAASTTYHTLNLSEKALKIFRKIDHMMIFVKPNNSQALNHCQPMPFRLDKNN